MATLAQYLPNGQLPGFNFFMLKYSSPPPVCIPKVKVLKPYLALPGSQLALAKSIARMYFISSVLPPPQSWPNDEVELE